MLIKKPTPEKSGIDIAMENVLSEMQGFEAHTDEYAQMIDQIVKLQTVKECNRPDRVSKDTMAIVFANLFGIALIVGHERANVVTSKAVSFLLKLR